MASSPSSSTEHHIYTQEILDRAAVWQLPDSVRSVIDFERACVTNAAIPLRRDGSDIYFTVFVSVGGSHLTTIEGNPPSNTLIVKVYFLKGGFQEKWTASHLLKDEVGTGATREQYLSNSHTVSIHGGVTEAGDSVLVVCRLAGGRTRAYTVTREGFTLQQPPSETASAYSLPAGIVSDDGEYIFYSRQRFRHRHRHRREAKAVEVFSLRTLARVRAMTFTFGDGRIFRNTRLLSPLRLRGLVYLAVDTGGGGFNNDDEDYGYWDSPTLIASSDGKTHWHANGLGSIANNSAKTNPIISQDGGHMVCVQKDDALLQHWDLKRPTLQPVKSVKLPGVDFGQKRRWIIHGKKTTIRDAVAEQMHCVRYSPGCKVITVVTASASKVVVNVFTTFNFQLIYHQKIEHTAWPGLTPAHIGFNETTGLVIVGLSPTLTRHEPNLPSTVVGVTSTLLPLEAVYKKIQKIENYFDSASGKISTLMKSAGTSGRIPEIRFSWRPGVFDRDDDAAIVHELGRRPLATAQDAQRQRDFYDKVFASPSSSVQMPSTSELHHFGVPHLFSFTYPWAPEQRVSVFGVVMRYEYHIVAIGPSPSSPGNSPDVIRALYVTKIETDDNIKERIDIFKSDDSYILHVSLEQGSISSSYIGAPMPMPRSTILSPHFLEEDAWYDVFVIQRAAHVTMPSEWSHTPNPALMMTSNIHAYFLPQTFALTDVVDYGLRTHAAYAPSKYLLWRDYGLRGLRVPRLNDVFFGGGRYADTIGRYLQSIYDDATYDDSRPLFPSTFALVCNTDYRSRSTKHVDAFFRRLHQDKQLVLANSQSVACTLPLACKAQPMALLSFMRHIVLFKHRINGFGIVQATKGASSEPTEPRYNYKGWYHFRLLLRDIISLLVAYTPWKPVHNKASEPHTSHVTLPLQDFCSFNHKLYEAPLPVESSSSAFWEMFRAAMPLKQDDFARWEPREWARVESTGQRPASPFTRLVVEILAMKDREIQLSFLKVVWLQKLLEWKMATFGVRIYLTRTVLPTVLLFVAHLVVSILATQSDDTETVRITVAIIVFASLEMLLSIYMLYTKVRQVRRVPQLFFRSVPNYVNAITSLLGVALFSMVVSGHPPPRVFLAFSTLLIWVAAILMLRIYRPVGMLLLLLTETLQEVFSYLALLFFIILGFAFVPFLLLRNFGSTDTAAINPFTSFSLTISQMLNFIASDYSALKPFEAGSDAVRTLRALFIIVITILFLNTLIALLNLKIKVANKNAANLYHLQIASLQVEIELGLLSSSERARRDWFPEWFSYSMTEREKRIWNAFLEENPLEWTKKNNFDEDKDHAPPVSLHNDSHSSGQPATTAKVGTKGHKDGSSTDPSAEEATSSKAHKDSKPGLDMAADTSGDLSEIPSCIVCSKPGTPCEKCGQVAYCSEEHKVADVNLHEIECVHDDEIRQASQVEVKKDSNQAAGRGPLVGEPAESRMTCLMCSAPGKRCEGCMTVAYCGKEHQRADWKRHKGECKSLGKAKAKVPSGDSTNGQSAGSA